MEDRNGLVSIDITNYLVQLDNFRLIVQMNDHLFVDNPLAKEQLTLEFERLEGYLGEVEQWEGQGECVKYNHAIAESKTALNYIRVLIEEILSQ